MGAEVKVTVKTKRRMKIMTKDIYLGFTLRTTLGIGNFRTPEIPHAHSLNSFSRSSPVLNWSATSHFVHLALS